MTSRPITKNSSPATFSDIAPPSPIAINANAPQKLRLGLLIALVVGSMIGSGIFSLPQNMANGAAAGAIIIGWVITGVGMLMLAFVYQTLSLRKPNLDNGIYAYARASSGEFVGFNSAWGYWVSAWVGNVGYLVGFFGALGFFFPVFGEGNTRAAIIGASIMIWGLHFLVLRGIRAAAVLNAITTAAKLVPILLFLVILIAAFKIDNFRLDFWGAPKLGSVLDQVKSTMLVTVWVFIGIEGASVYSARAEKREDVGKATIAGFIITLVLLMGVSLLSLGVLTQPELAGLKNPSMAGVLEKTVGTWGMTAIGIGLLVSVGGALLAWTLLASEMLFSPAKDGVMPKFLTTQNKNGVPANALWLTNGLVQIFLLITLFSNATYLALISLATSMILVPYLFSAIYAGLIAWRSEGYTGSSQNLRTRDLAIGALATVYCSWLLYAAGLKYLQLSALLYAPGVVLYAMAKREDGKPLFKRFELVVFLLVALLALIAGYSLYVGKLKL
jgi:arginine:ornithine antiporter/lysine permease